MNKSQDQIRDHYRRLSLSPSFSELISEVQSGSNLISLSGLNRSSKYFVLSALAANHNLPLLYIVGDKKHAQKARESLSYFLGENTPVLTHNPPETEPLYSAYALEQAEKINWLDAAYNKKVLVAEAAALLRFELPLSVFVNLRKTIETGTTIAREELLSELYRSGYSRTDFVEKPSDVSIRGSVIDIFSPGSEYPWRLELLGDEVASIRTFNISDQKSVVRMDSITVLPATTIIIDESSRARAKSYILKKSEESELPARIKNSLVEEIGSGISNTNMQWLLPAFYKKPDTPLAYLDPDTLVVIDDPDTVESELDYFQSGLKNIERVIKKTLKISPSAHELFITPTKYLKELGKFKQVHISELDLSGAKTKSITFDTEKATIPRNDKDTSPIDCLSNYLADKLDTNTHIELVFDTELERKKLIEILSDRKIKGIKTTVGRLENGLAMREANTVIITEHEIFGHKTRVKTTKRATDAASAFITSFSELKPGDHIVHAEFGIGVFRNLVKLSIGDTVGDFILCEYAGGDKIYVPIDKLKKVQRYIGDGKKPKVDKLGNQSWSKRLRKVRAAVETVAKELLMLYAERKTIKGFKFSRRDEMFREFELGFPYDETPDQEAAIDEVITDMESPKPMDRLICGDVGFGKTEVALRAAFKAVSDHKQVAFLVPTTLLAHQHYKTSLKRLEDYPITIDTLSRFRTSKEEKQIRERLAEGKLDIIIGTHKLLSDKIRYKNLGLIIIDEEHRFGVSQKEKLRKLKSGVDAIALSATPIPRTLQLSLSKIRDISLINTPPLGRQSIETNVYRSNDEIIRQAITRELDRDGSVFFVHNRIEDIHRVADRVKKLVPKASVDVTHGRMNERQLENSITKFIDGELDILVTTAIVESGLDIPRANTIIINDAQNFGLADLYQLRGRVGRSDIHAYAYFLVPAKNSLTPDARRRLKAISEIKELGSGFKLALSDLEIRGAGNLFGTEQSGHIGDVGLEMYLELLEGAIERIEGGDVEQPYYEPEIKITLPAYLPDDYIEESSERLLLYKRVSNVDSALELNSIRNELKDRFGKLPAPARNLLELVEIKLMMKELGIEKAEIGPQKTVIMFLKSSPLYKQQREDGRLIIYHEKGNLIVNTKNALKNISKLNTLNKNTQNM